MYYLTPRGNSDAVTKPIIISFIIKVLAFTLNGLNKDYSHFMLVQMRYFYKMSIKGEFSK